MRDYAEKLNFVNSKKKKLTIQEKEILDLLN